MLNESLSNDPNGFDAPFLPILLSMRLICFISKVYNWNHVFKGTRKKPVRQIKIYEGDICCLIRWWVVDKMTYRIRIKLLRRNFVIWNIFFNSKMFFHFFDRFKKIFIIFGSRSWVWKFSLVIKPISIESLKKWLRLIWFHFRNFLIMRMNEPR